jgi:hypothetical protein
MSDVYVSDRTGDNAREEHGLTWPAEWTPARPAAWVVATGAGLAALAGLAGVLAVRSLLAGDTAEGLLLSCAAVYLGHGVGLAVSIGPRRRRGRPGTTTVAWTGERGVVFPYARGGHYALAVLLLMTFAGSAVVVAALVPTRSAGPAELAVLGLFGTAALGSLWFLVEVVRAYRARPSVVLTPSGLYHRRITFEHYLPWSAVFAVSADQKGREHLITAKADPSEQTRVRMLRRRSQEPELLLLPYLVVRGSALAVDPATVYHAVRHYHAHRADRGELGTDSVPERVRR